MATENMKIFRYGGNSITFTLQNGDVLVNLTEMAKPFGKETTHFLQNKQTQDFVSVLDAKLRFPSLEVVRGGSRPGTWAHQKLALKFAAWLSPEFELWVFDCIDELLKQGYTKLDTISRKDLAKMLWDAEEEKERLASRIELQNYALKEAAPKVKYCEEVLQSQSLITTTVIAKQLGMTANRLNTILKEKQIIFKSGATWVLRAKYQNQGYTETKTIPYTDQLNRPQSHIHTYWTEKGRMFVISLLSNGSNSNLKPIPQWQKEEL